MTTSSLKYWTLYTELTVTQSVLLMLGLNPTSYKEFTNSDCYPLDFHTIVGALKNDLEYEMDGVALVYDMNIDYSASRRGIDWDATKIQTWALKDWLLSKNLTPEFFFPNQTDSLDYLNVKHPRYSAKLGAAIAVWIAMEDESLLRGKTPINAMQLYLTNNYEELGLSYKQTSVKGGYKIGDRNKGAIEKIVNIVNWSDKGGAPYTPVSAPTTPSEHIDFDDKFPF